MLFQRNTLVADAVLQPQANFTESTLIDYRWFSAKNITPRFEFGFGLSYSTFAYSSINARSIYIADNTSVQRTAEPVEGSKGLYDVVLQVTAKVKNTGKVTAGEVAQLVSPSISRRLRGLS
jgi:beta-glucosidase